MLLGSGPVLNVIHLIHEQANKTHRQNLRSIFNDNSLQNPYALGFLIAAWAGAKITERSSLHLFYAITLNLIAFFQIRHGSEDLQRM